MDNQFLLNPFFLDSPAPLLNRLLKPAWIVNRPAIGGSSQPARIQAIHAPLVERVGAVAAAGDRPVSVGGDCLQTAAVLAGLRLAGIDPVIVWLDAHGTSTRPRRLPAASSAACRWPRWLARATAGCARMSAWRRSLNATSS